MSFFEEFCAEKVDYPQTAKYFPKLPKPQRQPTSGLVDTLVNTVSYDLVYRNETMKDRSWVAVIPNVMTEGARKSIKTPTVLPYKTGGFIQTQDGCFYRIEQILSDDSTKDTEESLRLFTCAAEKEYILRLTQVDYANG